MIPRREIGQSMCKVRKINENMPFFMMLPMANDPWSDYYIYLNTELPEGKSNLVKNYINYSFWYRSSKTARFDIPFLK